MKMERTHCAVLAVARRLKDQGHQVQCLQQHVQAVECRLEQRVQAVECRLEECMRQMQQRCPVGNIAAASCFPTADLGCGSPTCSSCNPPPPPPPCIRPKTPPPPRPFFIPPQCPPRFRSPPPQPMPARSSTTVCRTASRGSGCDAPAPPPPPPCPPARSGSQLRVPRRQPWCFSPAGRRGAGAGCK